MNARAIVHPTLDALSPVFLSDTSPRARLAAAMPLLDGTHHATSAFAAAIRAATRSDRRRFGLDVRFAARLDGATIAEAQQFFGAFNPTRRRDLSAWQFKTLKAARVPEVVAGHATATLDLLDPGGVQRVNIWVFPADHANAHTMLRLFGVEAWGDSPGGVAVQLWPSPGNIARLGPVVTRAVALGMRTTFAWPTDRPPTLADHLAREGLAALAVATRFPNLPNPWAAPFTAAPDWDDVLATVAATAGIATYAALPVNVYGVVAPAGDTRLPTPVPPDTDESAYARAVLAADLQETDPSRIAAHLYGDAIVAMNGHPPVGMSPFAGIAAAHALVTEACTPLPSQERVAEYNLLRRRYATDDEGGRPRERRIDLLTALRLPTAALLDGEFA